MLPKTNRITKKRDFDIIFKNGMSFKNSSLVLRVVKNNLAQNRFGFITSQKVSKKAVERNKIRRRLSEVIKAKGKDIKNGYDMVFISLPEIKTKDISGIKDAVDNLLIKAKIINV